MFPFEIQYESTGIIEKSYRKEILSNETISELSNILKGDFVLENIELVSFYKEEIVLVYKGFHPKFSNQKKLLDYYVIKVNLKTKEFYFKLYTFDFDRYPIPPLPKTSIYKTQFGIGYYPEKEDLKDVIDIYFYNQIPVEVCNFFNNENLKKVSPFINCNALFAITFNYEKKIVLKLKRYIYPSDIRLRNFETI